MSESTFSLQTIGAAVLYQCNGTIHVFTSLVKAHRYIRRWNAVKVSGDANKLSGVYVIKAQ